VHYTASTRTESSWAKHTMIAIHYPVKGTFWAMATTKLDAQLAVYIPTLGNNSLNSRSPRFLCTFVKKIHARPRLRNFLSSVLRFFPRRNPLLIITCILILPHDIILREALDALLMSRTDERLHSVCARCIRRRRDSRRAMGTLTQRLFLELFWACLRFIFWRQHLGFVYIFEKMNVLIREGWNFSHVKKIVINQFELDRRNHYWSETLVFNAHGTQCGACCIPLRVQTWFDPNQSQWQRELDDCCWL
jgi:hypothetical protein